MEPRTASGTDRWVAAVGVVKRGDSAGRLSCFATFIMWAARAVDARCFFSNRTMQSCTLGGDVKEPFSDAEVAEADVKLDGLQKVLTRAQ